jgi:hypothetical protein
MAVQALPLNLPHQNRIDLLKFQYKEKLNKIKYIAHLITHFACGIIGGFLGGLYTFPAVYVHVLLRSQVSPFTLIAVQFGGGILYILGIYKLWNRWGIYAKINRLIDSFLAPYQKTYADLNN